MKQILTFDFHSHILPQADHGASSVKESLTLLRSAKLAGIETVIGTPHFYPHIHRVEDFIFRRDHSYEKLEPYFKIGDIPKVLRGAEVLVCSNIDRMKEFSKLAIENSNTFLLELPFVISEHTDELFDTIDRMINEKYYNIFIAHPNRYPTESIIRVIELGAKLQLNIEDVISFREKKRSLKWIEEGYVYAIGSDAHHNPTIYKKFPKGGKYFKQYLNRINNPLKIIKQ